MVLPQIGYLNALDESDSIPVGYTTSSSTMTIQIAPDGYSQCPKCDVLYVVDPVFGEKCPCCRRRPNNFRNAMIIYDHLEAPAGDLFHRFGSEGPK